MLQRAQKNQKWPVSGQIGDLTPAIWGVPNASERGTESAESAVARKWADWLQDPSMLFFGGKAM